MNLTKQLHGDSEPCKLLFEAKKVFENQTVSVNYNPMEDKIKIKIINIKPFI